MRPKISYRTCLYCGSYTFDSMQAKQSNEPIIRIIGRRKKTAMKKIHLNWTIYKMDVTLKCKRKNIRCFRYRIVLFTQIKFNGRLMCLNGELLEFSLKFKICRYQPRKRWQNVTWIITRMWSDSIIKLAVSVTVPVLYSLKWNCVEMPAKIEWKKKIISIIYCCKWCAFLLYTFLMFVFLLVSFVLSTYLFFAINAESILAVYFLFVSSSFF